MFGKTRLGKSNVVKLLVQGMLDATALFCPICQTAMPVRKRLLLVLPEGDRLEVAKDDLVVHGARDALLRRRVRGQLHEHLQG